MSGGNYTEFVLIQKPGILILRVIDATIAVLEQNVELTVNAISAFFHDPIISAKWFVISAKLSRC